MGYHTAGDIPNYWSWALHYVLQDHMFEPNASWSLPAHLFLVSEWSARCHNHDPSSCHNALENPAKPPKYGSSRSASHGPIYAWTHLTWLLHKYVVSWGYYVAPGSQPDCPDPQDVECGPVPQNARTPGIWNPLPWFHTVREDGQVSNVQPVSNFVQQASKGTLPSVSWVVPSERVSKHPPAKVSAGQSYVTRLIDSVMRGPDWGLDRDLPGLGRLGRLLRPGDPRPRSGRLPGRAAPRPEHGWSPGPRPDVRGDDPILGDLASDFDFDFDFAPRPPMPLPIHPVTTLTEGS